MTSDRDHDDSEIRILPSLRTGSWRSKTNFRREAPGNRSLLLPGASRRKFVLLLQEPVRRLHIYLFLWERPEKLFEKNASQVRCIVM